MTIEAMKQALEALELYQSKSSVQMFDVAAKGLRAAIEQAEQPRQWQGLTKDELLELWELNTEQPFPEWFVDFKRAYEVIEAKLKEKNA